MSSYGKSTVQSIRFIVDRYHVGTPDEIVASDIRRRCRIRRATPKQEERAVRDALAVHRANQKLYSDVVGGRIK
jgi:hypothetical protein